MDEMIPPEVIEEGARGPNPDHEKTLVETEVTNRLRAIESAREYDKGARKQYKVDRAYARGDAAGYEVSTNILGSIIEVLEAFLYAQDPDIQVKPSPAVSVNQDLVKATVEATWEVPPELEMILAQIPDPAMQQQMREDALKMEVYRRLQSLKRRHAEIFAFSQTIQIVVSRLWKRGRLKHVGKRWVRSAQTIGIGWIKCTWQEQYHKDPVVMSRLSDLQENLARIVELQRAMADEEENRSEDDLHQMKRDLEDQMRGLEDQAEVVIARGLVFDLIPGEMMQVSKDVPDISDYYNAAWITHSQYITLAEAKAKFNEVDPKRWADADIFVPNPNRPKAETQTGDVDYPGRASWGGHDSFIKDDGGDECDENDRYVLIEEQWDRDHNTVYTMAKGMKCYLRAPYSPKPGTSRFYPFFGLAFRCVDGERHPQSLPFRLASLQEEYHRTRSNFAEHRRRSLPGVIFDKSEIDKENAEALEKSTIQEWVGIETTTGQKPFNQLFANKPVSPIDFALYSVEPIRSDMETVSGAQDAMQSGVRTPKTATEAEIQQSGFGARIGSQRDNVEDKLGELAQYSVEIALQVLDPEDVERMAGPNFIWPELQLSEIQDLIDVEIQAGSTGKPGTSADREAWAMVLPMIREIMDVVGQLRSNGLAEQAEPYVELLRETFARWGENMDVERFLPALEAQPPQPQAQPGRDPAMGGAMGGGAGVDPGAGPAPNPQDIPNNVDSVQTDPGALLAAIAG